MDDISRNRDQDVTSRELVSRSLRGEPVPRPACGPLATFFCAVDAGISLREFSLNPEAQVECLLRYYETYLPDSVWISADTWITAEAMGAPVSAPSENQPLGGPQDGFIDSVGDLERLPPPDPYSQGRQPLMLDVLSRIVEALGEETFVVGCFDQAPLSLACQAMGLRELMARIYEDPPFIDTLLEKCMHHALAYGQAMQECGAHMLSTGDSPAGLLGPELYASLALPAEKELFRRLREKGDTFLSLHICGDSTAILPQMVDSGAHVLEIDHQVNLSDAFRVAGSRVAVWGNMDPVEILRNGTRERVEGAAGALLETAHQSSDSRFVLSSGCILAPDTPSANVRALIETARSWVPPQDAAESP
jgi:uroporphyrinogen decarboxylase